MVDEVGGVSAPDKKILNYLSATDQFTTQVFLYFTGGANAMRHWFQ
ncbi:hypothetical protein RJD24_10605 [Bacillaceae bacterium IKA-2]|nr:hypothetical protein RJD24_10605 [Bacillaceae bacterium IKA-2]